MFLVVKSTLLVKRDKMLQFVQKTAHSANIIVNNATLATNFPFLPVFILVTLVKISTFVSKFCLKR